MRNTLQKWDEENREEAGHYAVLRGFETALKAHSETLAEWYGAAELDEQLALFSWVTSLLSEEVIP